MAVIKKAHRQASICKLHVELYSESRMESLQKAWQCTDKGCSIVAAGEEDERFVCADIEVRSLHGYARLAILGLAWNSVIGSACSKKA